MLWRFLPVIDPTVDIFLSRDLDSIVNEREVAAVKEWLTSSDQIFHGMRDNPAHRWEVLGGMWGAKNFLIYNEMKSRLTHDLFIAEYKVIISVRDELQLN